MRVKEKAAVPGGEAIGVKTIGRPLLAECAIRLISGFILARARIFGEYAPFGVAFAASSNPGYAGIMSTLGVLLGLCSFGDMVWALKYIGIIILIRSTLYILRGAPIAEGQLFSPIVTLVSALMISFAYAFGDGFTVTAAVMFITESCLMGGCAFFYNVVFTPWSDLDDGSYGRACHTAATVIFVGTVIISLCPAVLFGTVSIGRALSVLLVIAVTYKGGVGYGSAFGAAVGAACDLASGSFPLYSSIYALSAAISGIFSGDRRAVYVLIFITSNAIGVVWSWQQYGAISALYEIFVASVIFMLLPENVLSRLNFFFPSSVNGIGYLRAREYTRGHVELAVSAFRDLYGTVKAFTGDNDTAENPARIFDTASEKVCRTCPNCTSCWQEEYSDTLDIMNGITEKLMSEGKIAPGDFPARFTEKCSRIDSLTDAINSETHLLMLRRGLMSRLGDSRRAAATQYADMSHILETVSAELGTGVEPEPALERKLTKYLRGLNLNANAAVFRVRGGRLRAEISGSISSLLRDEEYLDKLSSVLGVRLCTPWYPESAGKLLLFEAEPIKVTIGTSSAKRTGKRVNGDTSRCFRTDEGIFYAIISDGMGSGEEAERISHLTADCLRKLLLSGMSPSLSLHLMSDIMFIRSELETESASIDLFELNMFTGEGHIYKCGAAPTYLKRGEIVKRIPGGLLPAGLMRPGKDGIRSTDFKLRPGSSAVLISDGILSGSEDKWLRELLTEDEGNDPKALSLTILQKAQELGSGGDDMTVIAIKSEERA